MYTIAYEYLQMIYKISEKLNNKIDILWKKCKNHPNLSKVQQLLPIKILVEFEDLH